MSKRPLSSPDPTSSPAQKQRTALDLETEYNLDHTNHSHEILDRDFLTTSPPTAPTLRCFANVVMTCPHMDQSKFISLVAQWDDLQVPLQKIWDKCLSERSFGPLRRVAYFQVRAADPPAPPIRQHAYGISANAVQATYVAFSREQYLGPTSSVLLKVMDTYLTTGSNSYNRSLAIVQSSGMGKSRTVEAAAAKRFCLPFNLREQLPVNQYTYPLPDTKVQTFLLRDEHTDQMTQLKFAIFLYTLFCRTAQELEEFVPSESLACKWQTRLHADETAHKVGSFRARFYHEIVDSADNAYKQEQEQERSRPLGGNDSTAARSLRTSVTEKSQEVTNSPRAEGEDPLLEWLTAAALSCQKLSDLVETKSARLYRQETVFFLYFDEAHGLTKDIPGQRTQFHNLGTVLSALNTKPMFTIFLSTNSDLRGLAAPAHLNPSLRVMHSQQLLPPITEMPFDVFTQGGGSNFTAVSTLQHACTLDIITRFGRPLWHALHKNNYGAGQTPGDAVIGLAMTKLSPRTNDGIFHSKLACLSIRILLDFDSARETAREVESELVRGYMRVAYAVPEHRQYMRTGTPSEPVLAEAAARQLKVYGGIEATGPDVLAEAFRAGHLARGERGEMIGRLLLTIAHDNLCSTLKPVDGLQYHQPIKVVDFLKSLIMPDWHEAVLAAKPIGDHKGLSLNEAFQHAWIHFSHFALAGDYKVVKSDHLYKFGLRGTALQCRANQRDIDNILPMIFGESLEDAVLSKSNSAPFSCQIKNRNVTEDFLVSPTVTTGKDACPNPTLTLVMELGSRENKVCPTPITLSSTRTSSKIYAKSYQIVLHGASAATYRVITNVTQALYEALLARTDVIEDFPRRDIPECLNALKNMKPDFVEESSLAWSGLLENP